MTHSRTPLAITLAFAAIVFLSACAQPPRISPKQGMRLADRAIASLPEQIASIEEPPRDRDIRWDEYSNLANTRTALDFAVAAGNALGVRAGMTHTDADALTDAFNAVYQNLVDRAAAVASPAWRPSAGPVPAPEVQIPQLRSPIEGLQLFAPNGQAIDIQ